MSRNSLTRLALVATTIASLGSPATAGPTAADTLTKAETLLHTGQVAKAREMLREIVASDPTSAAAAEAQCRIGKSYEDAGDTANAVTAYLACRRLRGGDAADTARRRLQDLMDTRNTAARHKISPASQSAREAAAVLQSLARPGLTRTARAAAERRLTTALVRACGNLTGESAGGDALLAPAIAAVRTPDLQEILRYLRLMASDSPAASASRQAALMDFARTAHSRVLRTAVLLTAAEGGYLADAPDRLLAAVTPEPTRAAIAADPATRFLHRAVGDDMLESEVDPSSVIEVGTDILRDRLLGAAFSEGRLEDMVRYDAALLVADAHDQGDRRLAAYRQYTDSGRAPLRLFARATALREKDPAQAVPLFMSVARKYPASALAVPSLLAAETLLRQTHKAAEADVVRDQILHDHPDSPAGLFLRARAAADRNALDEAASLLDRAAPPDRRMTEDQDIAAQDLEEGVFYLRGAITETLKVRKALRPIAEVAGRPALANVSLADLSPPEGRPSDRKKAAQDGDGDDQQNDEGNAVAALADRLADAMPSQAVAVYRALMPEPPFQDLRMSLHALAHDPLGPATVPVWDALTSESAMDMGIFMKPARADEVALAATLLDRTAGTSRTAQGVTLFERVVGGGGGVPIGEWRQTEVAARAVADAHPGTRAGIAARCLAAQTLLENSRPEDAAALLDEPSVMLSADDPLAGEAALLRRRAAEEVAAKHGPDWTPLWQAQVGPPGKIVIASDAPETPPGVTGGTLVMLWPGNRPEDNRPGRGWAGLAGLDPTKGKRKWAVPLSEAVRDIALAAGRAFAFTQEGDLVALDAATGHLLYRQPLARDPQSVGSGWITATDTTLVAVTGQGVSGLDPATGRTRWHQSWLLTGIRGEPDKPPLIGGTLYCATTDGHLRAVDSATGAVLWDRATDAVDPDTGQIGGGQPVPAGPHALLRRWDGIEAWDASAGQPLPAGRQVPGRIWMDGLLSDGHFMVMWDQNMAGTVSRLPDLMPTGVRVPPKADEENGLLLSGVLYASMGDPLDGGTVFEAVDVATGAVLGWWPLGGFSAGSWAGEDDAHIYYAGTDGSVRAFRRLGTIPLTE